MYRLVKPSERPAAVGFGLLVLGLLGIAILHFSSAQHTALFVAATCCWIIGLLTFRIALYVNWANQSRALERVRNSADGVLWLRIAATALWLCILPIVLLWVYHYFHRV